MKTKKKEKKPEKPMEPTKTETATPSAKTISQPAQKDTVDGAGKKLEPLGDGQRYFEAPDGTVLIGDANKDRIWYRPGNCWINPKR